MRPGNRRIGASPACLPPPLCPTIFGERIRKGGPAILGPAPDARERRRLVIENVRPEVDGGRFAVKRIVGDLVRVEADVFADGHDELACSLLYRREAAAAWQEVRMARLADDRWRGEFRVGELGPYAYRIHAWVDRFRTWRRDLQRRLAAGQDVTPELSGGAGLLREVSREAPAKAAERLAAAAAALGDQDRPLDLRVELALDDELAALADRWALREPVSVYDRGRVVVDRERARFAAWYELFPRSTAAKPGEHGTFQTTIARLPYIADLGFDVLYLPPIHPIGHTSRKGKNNAPVAAAADPGSPWAVGGEAGGHKAVHPQLGTIADFRRLVKAAGDRGIEVALDLAFQCSPDHPYVREKPQWFRHRPDGSVRFAENPPKRYEDIYPFDFETEDWRSLWQELASVVRFWVDLGVRLFRADNPHTKPFPFWEWLIGQIKAEHPDVVFLSEAFTARPTMYHLSKLGFSQSYTYFAWRNTKQELISYLQELASPALRDDFRPVFWPNTPDILHAYLQSGGRPAFIVRLVLAATLAATYGIYGPAYELCLDQPLAPGSEEYLDSEKYELKRWDLTAAAGLSDLIGRLNRVRRENAALQRDDGLRFLEIDNDELIAYSKVSPDGENVIVVVVNLDPHNVQAGWLRLPLADLGLRPNQPYQLHDLLNEATFTWTGERNQLRLEPEVNPAQVFRLARSPVV